MGKLCQRSGSGGGGGDWGADKGEEVEGLSRLRRFIRSGKTPIGRIKGGSKGEQIK